MSNVEKIETSIKVVYQNMFGEIEESTFTVPSNDYTYMQHEVYERFGTCEFEIVSQRRFETNEID